MKNIDWLGPQSQPVWGEKEKEISTDRAQSWAGIWGLAD